MSGFRNTHVYIPAAFVLMGLVGCSPRSETAVSPAGAASQAPAVVVVHEVEAPRSSTVSCSNCGTVRSVSAVSNQGAGTGVGAVLGALVGGLAGNQVGGGDGKKLATVAGVIGGAVVGNKIEANRNGESYYEITIDMDDGGQRVIVVPNASGLAPGASVTVNGSNIALR